MWVCWSELVGVLEWLLHSHVCSLCFVQATAKNAPDREQEINNLVGGGDGCVGEVCVGSVCTCI